MLLAQFILLVLQLMLLVLSMSLLKFSSNVFTDIDTFKSLYFLNKSTSLKVRTTGLTGGILYTKLKISLDFV